MVQDQNVLHIQPEHHSVWQKRTNHKSIAFQSVSIPAALTSVPVLGASPEPGQRWGCQQRATPGERGSATARRHSVGLGEGTEMYQNDLTYI